MNATRPSYGRTYTVQEDFKEEPVPEIEKELPAQVPLEDYEEAILELIDILSEYDRFTEDKKPVWSDALSLKLIEWGREVAKVEIVDFNAIAVIAKERLEKLAKVILVDPSDPLEGIALKKPVLYTVDDITVYVEEAFAQQHQKLCCPDKVVAIKIHSFALEMITWSARAMECIEREIAASKAFNGKAQHSVPAEPATALQKRNVLPLPMNFGSMGNFAAMGTFMERSKRLPWEIQIHMFQQRYSNMCHVQAEECHTILDKWKSQQIALDSQQRLKENTEGLHRLAAKLAFAEKEWETRLKKLNDTHEKDTAVLRRDLRTLDKKLSQVKEQQWHNAELVRQLRQEISATRQENQELRQQLSTTQNQRSRGFCTIF